MTFKTFNLTTILTERTTMRQLQRAVRADFLHKSPSVQKIYKSMQKNSGEKRPFFENRCLLVIDNKVQTLTTIMSSKRFFFHFYTRFPARNRQYIGYTVCIPIPIH